MSPLARATRLFRRLLGFLEPKPARDRASQLVSQVLPPLICVDVGASYFPHAKWRAFLNSPRTTWLAVDPNAQNLAYVAHWKWPAKVAAKAAALSESGGARTLHVTNVDSGSSLLPPVVTASMRHRITSPDYFFPVKEIQIETVRLSDLLTDIDQTLPILIKLDTQGSELSILRGSSELLAAKRVVGIELESTLQAEPVMQGSGKFWQACEFLESEGFELLFLDPIHAPARSERPLRTGHRTFLNECDAVFALRRDQVSSLSINHRLVLLGFYVDYGYFDEAASLLDEDVQLREHVGGADSDVMQTILDCTS